MHTPLFFLRLFFCSTFKLQFKHRNLPLLATPLFLLGCSSVRLFVLRTSVQTSKSLNLCDSPVLPSIVLLFYCSSFKPKLNHRNLVLHATPLFFLRLLFCSIVRPSNLHPNFEISRLMHTPLFFLRLTSLSSQARLFYCSSVRPSNLSSNIEIN
jgi:hypothetical protein